MFRLNKMKENIILNIVNDLDKDWFRIFTLERDIY